VPRRLGKEIDGTAAIEFGLTLPLLMIVLVGILDYGQIHFTRLTMTNAAREGARVGVTLKDDAQAAAIAATQAYLTQARVTATVTATAPTQASPTVTVTVTIDPYKPLIGLIPTPGRLWVSASMRWEFATP
jgi:Flp pilus assembly protein TadG